jgi:gamma-glutamylcyclotransferase (GGCT)/AIG2-like uncharacterized protein YtfP
VASADAFTLFVYGTLMRDGCRHSMLAQQRYLGEARTLGSYELLDFGAHPALVRCQVGGRVVAGELYEVAASLQPVLDEVEGAPALFRLEPVAIAGASGTVFAYFYVPDPAGLPRYGGKRWHNRP